MRSRTLIFREAAAVTAAGRGLLGKGAMGGRPAGDGGGESSRSGVWRSLRPPNATASSARNKYVHTITTKLDMRLS